MKFLIYTGFFIVIILLSATIMVSLSSRKQPVTGMVSNQLRACPVTPNCVCSEFETESYYIKPISYSIAHEDAWTGIKQAIKNTGGEILYEENNYLHARYTTPLIRFQDDVEMRIDIDGHIIHIRSASRVGHSDLGANRKRVEKIRHVFDQLY